MSSQYENTIAKRIHRQTPSHIRAYRCGYSGNNAMPQPDILVTTPSQNHGVELKGPIQSERVYIDDEDLEQLYECQNAYTSVYLGIKFQRREPLVVRYFEKLTGGQQSVDGADEYNEMDIPDQFATLIPSAFNPRVTDADTLALDKPSTDDWPSATKGSDDVDALLSGMGVVTPDSIEVE